MDRSSPIPVATYGTNEKVAEAVCEKLLPDFEVVHVCLNLSSALRELPPLFAGDLRNAPPPSSGLGTHAALPSNPNLVRKVPQTLFFGGGFSDDEYDNIVHAVHTAAADRERKEEDERRADEEIKDAARSAAATATAGWKGKGVDRSGEGSGSGLSSLSREKEKETKKKEAAGVVLHVVKVQRRDVFAAGGFGPNPEVIARVFKRKMAAVLERAEEVQG